MRKFLITTDTTSDLPLDYVRHNNLHVVPLYYSFNDVIYGDENNLEPKEFYELMRNGDMPMTMAVNPDKVNSIFISLIEEGYDILHIAFSSALSGSYNIAAVAARDLMEEYPDAKITVIDSLSASLGEGLLIHKALSLQAEGKTMEEIIHWLEQYKLNLCHMFTVDDLFHLHRGGRLSKAAAIIGTLIHVKPVLHINDDGKLIPLQNVRGRKKALNTLVDEMEKRISEYKGANDTIFISHGDCIEDAEYVANKVKERFGIENILINYVSPTIGCHSGPGTVALFFMGNNR